jgi:hypothetical protein
MLSKCEVGLKLIHAKNEIAYIYQMAAMDVKVIGICVRKGNLLELMKTRKRYPMGCQKII